MPDVPQTHDAPAAPPADEPPDPEVVAAGYRDLREGAGLVDRSPSGKLALTGTEARTFLTGQVTADVEALEPGTGTYAALLTPKGKIVADLRIVHVGTSDDVELLLLCERSGLQALFDHLRRHLIGFDVELHKRTLQLGLLSLAGPRTGSVLGPAAEALADEEHATVAADVDGVPVRLVRTPAGVDVLPAAADTDAVRSALEQHGARPVDASAAEVTRVEAGRPRLHHEMDESVMPAEAGIVERAVSFTKGCYVGQETVARLHWRGRPNRHLRGLELERTVPVGTVIVRDGRELGRVTTCVDSPALGPIALALVRREIEPEDTVVLRPAEGGPTSARVVALPFRRAGGDVSA
ncbi:YgfZ/GcvT domain-containing protein [Patulibacter minatonensis]|uniref:CAF17-like 4Fe-4S cluster assembly/insertion protein YgfZ n=1 Tax=Patulibacter minatonensis TaxID=298163 RepID=UPI000A048193|nr:glycine cleavage T C-terminal barrel domain-containing protein [Patulibacter minatonensis]